MHGKQLEGRIERIIQRSKAVRWELAYLKALSWGYSQEIADEVASTSLILESHGINPTKAVRIAMEIHYNVRRKVV